MPASAKTHNCGSCLCGEITFEVSEFEPLVGHCHCNMCQKFHGAAFSTFGEVKLAHLIWLSGQHLLKHYRADNESVRSFCQNCGSSLLFESKYNRQASTIEIALSAFDKLDTVKPDAHIYTQSRAPWCQFTDDLPKFKGYRDSDSGSEDFTKSQK